AVTPAAFSVASTRWFSAASIAKPRLGVTCTEGSDGYRLGSVYSTLSITTSRMTTYFQRGNSSIGDFQKSVARVEHDDTRGVFVPVRRSPGYRLRLHPGHDHGKDQAD